MPSSTVRTFTDPDDYTSSIRAAQADLTITGRGWFTAKLIKINLHNVWMQRFSDNLPRVAHATDDPGNATIAFRTRPGPSLRRSGVEMRETNIIQRSEADD